MGIVSETAKAVVGEIIPPTEDAPKREQSRWRVTIALLVSANTIALVLAYGLTPWWLGFAYADSMLKLQNEIQISKLNDLAEGIPLMTKKSCEAPPGELKNIFFERLNSMRDQYYDIKKRPFPDLSCRDVGVF